MRISALKSEGRKWLCLLALLVSVWGCSREHEPAGILPKMKMAILLRDMHLAHEKLQTQDMHPDSLQLLKKLLEQAVYTRHRVSDTLYTESLRHYAAHPQALSEVYAMALDSLP